MLFQAISCFTVPTVFGKALVAALAPPAAAVLLGGVAVTAGVAGTGGRGGGAEVSSVAGAPAGAGVVAAAGVQPAPQQPDAIPSLMLGLYQQAAPTCPGLPWEALAGIGRVETDHGRNTAVSSAGAEGPMQFMPATWAEYGVDVHGTGVPDINDPADAVFAAARLLCADGASSPAGLPGAIFAYNHSDEYVAEVLGWAAAYRAEYG